MHITPRLLQKTVWTNLSHHQVTVTTMLALNGWTMSSHKLTLLEWRGMHRVTWMSKASSIFQLLLTSQTLTGRQISQQVSMKEEKKRDGAGLLCLQRMKTLRNRKTKIAAKRCVLFVWNSSRTVIVYVSCLATILSTLVASTAGCLGLIPLKNATPVVVLPARSLLRNVWKLLLMVLSHPGPLHGLDMLLPSKTLCNIVCGRTRIMMSVFRCYA
mmetsp:Transcript_1875/g.3290  ORF Transcript_1875/g.3290 Transcript_1875/m.3290 type:complete len:214 (+) Transcript_1875:481-1122(+)